MLVKPLSELRSRLSLDDNAFEGVSVLVLPENVESAESTNLKDAGDSVHLAKHLKSQGVACKTAYDLGFRPRVLDRRGIDVWLGVIWILEHIGAPSAVALISAWLLKKYHNDPSTRVHIDLKLQKGDTTSNLKFDGSLPDFQKVLSGLKGSDLERIEHNNT